MARNRKAQSAAIRFGPAVKAFLLCLLIGGSGVGFVWQKDQVARLGKQIGEREKKLKGLRSQNQDLNDTLSRLGSQKSLEGKIQEWKLGLAQPQPSQIWRLPEPSRDAARPAPEGQSLPETHALAGP
jgi:hypothetical protein